LLGDEVADRNGCSIWMLYIFKMLHEIDFPFVIIFSNHGYELLYNYEKNEPFQGHYMSEETFIASLIALQTIIDNGVISRSEVDALIERYYIPHLKLIDYSINKDNRLTYYSHSHAGRNTIMWLAYEFGIENHEDFSNTIEQRKEILEQIQAIFMEKAKNKELHTLVDLGGEDEDPDIWSETARLIWGRKLTWLVRLPEDLHVNGHDRTTNASANVILLDNTFGKVFSNKKNKYALYEALYTHENKSLNYSYFNEMLNNIKSTIYPCLYDVFKEYFSNLFNENTVYSLFQIQTLQWLLCTFESISVWKLLLDSCGKGTVLLHKIMNNQQLRDCLYLLYTLELFSKEMITLVLKQNNYRALFSFLLIFMDNKDLLQPDVLRYFLSKPEMFQATYPLELRQKNDLTKQLLAEYATINLKKTPPRSAITTMSFFKEEPTPSQACHVLSFKK
jgi:hypothetical protein